MSVKQGSAVEAAEGHTADSTLPKGPSVAVVGASGYIGTNLVPRLIERGASVRAVARSIEVLAARGWPGVELAAADVLVPETLDAALAGIDIAYYLVHCMRAGDEFEKDRAGWCRKLCTCRRASWRQPYRLSRRPLSAGG